jgi:hypothetical protein
MDYIFSWKNHMNICKLIGSLDEQKQQISRNAAGEEAHTFEK